MKKLAEVLKDWEAVIGLEVHTELTALDTQMFCNCRLSHDDEPNTNVCPVCLGMPGALPVPNRRAIESIVMAGLATNCQIQKHSMFYRKHYFYPDMTKNFQTTQGPVAFAMYGHLDLEVSGQGADERPDHVETGNVAPGGVFKPQRRALHAFVHLLTGRPEFTAVPRESTRKRHPFQGVFQRHVGFCSVQDVHGTRCQRHGFHVAFVVHDAGIHNPQVIKPHRFDRTSR